MKIAYFPKSDADGFVYVAIKKGMYDLPKAGILAQELREKRLNAHGYRQSANTPGLWMHDWRPKSFTLVVDDFGVKYVGNEHADHLVNVVKEHYEVKEDWDGKRYIGLTFDWDYTGQRSPSHHARLRFRCPQTVQARTPKQKPAPPTNTPTQIMEQSNNLQKRGVRKQT